MKIIAVIPARGGSKGIKNKNLIRFKGKPLIYWSIKTAQKSKLIDDFYVSTDNNKIKRLAINYNCKVIDRPKRLSRDNSTTLSVLKHAYIKTKADTIICLQPTSPIRPPQIVDKMIKIYKKKNCDSLATGRTMHIHEWGKFNNIPRQKTKSWFWDDGLIYILDKKLLKKNIWCGKNSCKVEISKKYNLIEIDDKYDLKILKKIHE